MSVTTHDYAKIGTKAYRVTIGYIDPHIIYTMEHEDFPTIREGEIWGLARVRTLTSKREDGVTYDAKMERIRWVPYTFPDDEYGTVYDASMEYDYTFNAYCDGMTWHDEHEPNGPRWED